MPSVLIVDDEPDHSDFVAAFLRRHGYQTRCVPNGRDALSTLLNNGLDAVILDVRMPGMSGIEVARRLVATHPEVVVVLISIEERVDVPSAAQLDAVPLVRKQDFGPRLLRRLWAERQR